MNIISERTAMETKSATPHSASLSRTMKATPLAIYRAWTRRIDQWLAAPGSVTMEDRVGAPFYFETAYKPHSGAPVSRQAHYGRFLQLEPGHLIEMSWMTGLGGTLGAETIVTVDLKPKAKAKGARLLLNHTGFGDRETAMLHQEAWPLILTQLDEIAQADMDEAPVAPLISAGRNIAMKVPTHQYEETVHFYQKVVGLEQIEELLPAICFKFGENRLWIDKMPAMSQAEIWLQLTTSDTARAAERLGKAGVARRDDIEPLGKDFDGFWIANPASIIHLIDRVPAN